MSVLPKTDYTYNPTSKWYRKEIAPGIPMIPNMARPPLHPHPPKSSFFSWFTREQTKTRSASTLSSSKYNCVSSSSSETVEVSWYQRVVTTIVTAVTTVWIAVTRSQITTRRMHNVNGVHAQRLKGRQLFHQEANAWWRLPFVWLYKLMMNIFAVDIGILSAVRRTTTRLRSSRTGIELFTLFLLLLPLLLFFGLYRDQFSNHKAFLIETVERTRSGFSSILSAFSDWGSGFYASMVSFWRQSQPTSLNFFDSLIDSISAATSTAGHIPSASAPTSSNPSMSHDQLVAIVEDVVRSLPKQDPNVMLTSEQWRTAVREAVHVYHVENPDKEADIINRRMDTIEKELIDRMTRLEGKLDVLVQTFVTRQTVEDAIKNLTKHFNYQIKIEGEHVMERVFAEITEKVKDDVTKLFHSLIHHNQFELTTPPKEVNLTQVQDYVGEMIERALCLYDADKTGMVDYALESSGGNVLNTRCTESYREGHQTLVLFGFALWPRIANSPRTLIQPGMHPGECWAFSGQEGYVVLQLSSTIKVTGFTVEHIPRSLVAHGRIDSAPKDFSVWGLSDEDDKEGTFLGRYRFQENGKSLQMFKANPVDQPFRVVELKIESNHGNLKYTCLYRFRVHGVPVT
ncbi:hypothetical protein LSTR_LSTR008646 [Laodelphax striatellus]|uniref:SUN domain-containing protein n=1 Tax=Laodelphax striatellus TaxID=195883 RepID=A0A482WN67_LAOST|nr:hypothetical protein LSTR_LSTR008646 [Laodelphax striatellus]